MTLQELIDEKYFGSLAEFAKAIGVERSTAHRWVTGQRIPRAGALEKISKLSKGRVTFKDFKQAAAEAAE